MDPLAAHRPEIRQQSFTCRLHRRDRTGFRSARIHHALCAAVLRPADVEMVADEMKKRFPCCEVPRTPDGMAVSAGFLLMDERQVPGMISCDGAERCSSSG